MRADGWIVIAGVRGVSTWEYGGWHRYGSLGLRRGKGGFRWSSVSIPRVLTLPRLSRQFKFAYYQKCIEYGIVHEPNLLGNEAKIRKQDSYEAIMAFDGVLIWREEDDGEINIFLRDWNFFFESLKFRNVRNLFIDLSILN